MQTQAAGRSNSFEGSFVAQMPEVVLSAARDRQREAKMPKTIECETVGPHCGNPLHLRVTHDGGRYLLILFRKGADNKDYKPISFEITHADVQAIAHLSDIGHESGQ
jgi:hypothetical protein